jgi:hypothetical protein
MSDTLGKVILTAETIRENELRRIQGYLRANGLIFSFSHHYLYHKSNVRDIADDAQRAVDLLAKSGFTLRVVPGIFAHETFALKSADGLVLQKLQNALRIFVRVRR